VRFPERKIAIDEHRDTGVWVEGKGLGLALFALGQINRNNLACEPQL